MRCDHSGKTLSRIFKGQGPAATLGPCNNMWSVPKMEKRGTKRWNPKKTENDALQWHSPGD